ncbi:hypothetical protein, partial [Streptococcus suis]|uniref:hypothetical protein n=1 Tax=Streptococcus suis TaxID=1307 RepID=UPI001E5D204F
RTVKRENTFVNFFTIFSFSFLIFLAFITGTNYLGDSWWVEIERTQFVSKSADCTKVRQNQLTK